ncbi:MAG: lipopolysaccharide heptosyltransferase [Thiothrix lacustris]|uniref:Lipopolysaccharide heptosyltransferase n=1 Tax=Thiothrix lacustris TaxID=525917 RepID=A0A1Y1QM76_9GAMM|nr:MAG: lipopolysaccharide heptosyltransferase [Thiothrix lacustris]
MSTINVSVIKRILIIIRRSNGDVLLASPLIQHLHEHYPDAVIDLLVNDDTLGIAKALQPIRQIQVYSYQWKKLPWRERFQKTFGLMRALFRRYDLAISLTATDSSVLYALLAARHAISTIEAEPRKNWWKKRLLTGCYVPDPARHTLLNNLEPLRLLGIPVGQTVPTVHHSSPSKAAMLAKLQADTIGKFIIFHPSAQYGYKVYPEVLRHALLQQLSGLGIPIVVTGAKTALDLQIKARLPVLANVYDWIGETSLDEYIALSELSLAYVGGDTLNMHIAAAQNKQVFAIFGPTVLGVWSPWSNTLQCNATCSQPQQTYGNITVFQADMPCVPCGKQGCDNQQGNSECLQRIEPRKIFAAVHAWWQQEQV